MEAWLRGLGSWAKKMYCPTSYREAWGEYALHYVNQNDIQDIE